MTCHCFCHILLVTQTDPGIVWEEVMQVGEWQEVGIIGGHLGSWLSQGLCVLCTDFQEVPLSPWSSLQGICCLKSYSFFLSFFLSGGVRGWTALLLMTSFSGCSALTFPYRASFHSSAPLHFYVSLFDFTDHLQPHEYGVFFPPVFCSSCQFGMIFEKGRG